MAALTAAAIALKVAKAAKIAAPVVNAVRTAYFMDRAKTKELKRKEKEREQARTRTERKLLD